MVSAMRAAALIGKQIPPAATFVGSALSGTQSSANLLFSTLLDEGGGTPTVLQDDYVFVGVTRGIAIGTQMSLQGYSQIGTEINSIDTAQTFASLWWKKMSSSPDTQIAMSTGGAGACSYSVIVLRDVDLTTPVDTSQQTSGIDTSVPDVPSITPTVPGACVLGFGMAAVNGSTATALTIPGNADSQTNRFRQGGQTNAGTTYRTVAAVAMKKDNGPTTFDMNAFGGGVTTNTGSWAAFAVSVKPK